MNQRTTAYNSREKALMPALCLCAALVINSVYFSAHYFSSLFFFTAATFLTFLEMVLDFMLCGVLAVQLQQRLPGEKQVIKRLSLMICCFVLISILLKYFLFKGYEALPWLAIPFNEDRLLWVCLCIALINIFITFLMEGISRYEAWQQTMRETEALQTHYQQAQLQALKGQITPHFLFNNLNTLSSLIDSSEEEAETFLNEMTKVYRYLLQSDNQTLVTLDTELNFLNSYLFLLRTRFGAGLQTEISIDARDLKRKIVPSALQVVVEKAFYEQVLSKDRPLCIAIFSDCNHALTIRHNLQPKKITGSPPGQDPGLSTILKKYELLGRPIHMSATRQQQTFSIELISEQNHHETVV